MKGGCCCGAVRYHLASAPFDAGWCHCRTCQLNSGSPAMAFATVRSSDFRYDECAPLIACFAASGLGQRIRLLLDDMLDQWRALASRIAALDDDPAQLERVERVLTEVAYSAACSTMASTYTPTAAMNSRSL